VVVSNPAALVHENCLQLAGDRRVLWRVRSRFLSIAAPAKGRVLVDYAAARDAQTRNRRGQRGTLDELADG
jgi:hypothetical protein